MSKISKGVLKGIRVCVCSLKEKKNRSGEEEKNVGVLRRSQSEHAVCFKGSLLVLNYCCILIYSFLFKSSDSVNGEMKLKRWVGEKWRQTTQNRITCRETQQKAKRIF